MEKLSSIFPIPLNCYRFLRNFLEISNFIVFFLIFVVISRFYANQVSEFLNFTDFFSIFISVSLANFKNSDYCLVPSSYFWFFLQFSLNFAHIIWIYFPIISRKCNISCSNLPLNKAGTIFHYCTRSLIYLSKSDVVVCFVSTLKSMPRNKTQRKPKKNSNNQIFGNIACFSHVYSS